MTRESVPRSWSVFSLFLPTTTARMRISFSVAPPKQSSKSTTKIQSSLRKREKGAKLFGTPTKAQWKKRNTLLASTLRKLLESTTLDAGFAFVTEPSRDDPRECSKKLERFLPFSPHHNSPNEEIGRKNLLFPQDFHAITPIIRKL